MKLNRLKSLVGLLLKSPKMIKDSAARAFAFLACIETFMSVAVITLEDVGMWWVRLFLIIGIYCVFTVIILVFRFTISRKSITLSIRGIPVIIKPGNLFESDGWKLISFTNRYDTQVDDVIINKNSINGIFIDQSVGTDHLENLKQTILSDNDEEYTLYKRYMEDDKWKYPLGRIKIYLDYMLLAFTKIDTRNEVHTTRAEYEQCLRVMWEEISRTYANKPVTLPLLGSGILRFDDWPEKSNKELLKCMLCTLRTSGIHINQPVTILLTEKILQTINLYELKGEQ